MKRKQHFSQCLTAFLLVLVATAAAAVDGVILIDQNKALAGNVTPGDAPGFPVTITQPGSYRLSGNLFVPDEFTTGIVISAPEVTIDLNGFGIFGPGRPSGDTDRVGLGITNPGNPLANIAIRNGTIAGMGGSGIFLNGEGSVVIDVRSHNNAGIGIHVGNGVSLRGNSVLFNRIGIFAGGNAVIRGNVVRGISRGGEINVGCFPREQAGSSIVGNVATGGIEEAGIADCTRDQNSPAP